MLVTWELLGWELVEVPSRRHAHDLGPTWMDLFDSFKGVRFGVIGVRLLKISLCSYDLFVAENSFDLRNFPLLAPTSRPLLKLNPPLLPQVATGFREGRENKGLEWILSFP